MSSLHQLVLRDLIIIIIIIIKQFVDIYRGLSQKFVQSASY